jgi:hypothetical protein
MIDITVTIMVIIQILTMIVYSYFEKISDSKWAKAFKIYSKFNSERYLDFVELEEIERLKIGLHTWGAAPKVITALIFPIAMVITKNVELSAIFLFLIGLCINWVMDIHLNLIMGWGTWYRSKKRIMDKISFPVRFIILAIFIILSYLV